MRIYSTNGTSTHCPEALLAGTRIESWPRFRSRKDDTGSMLAPIEWLAKEYRKT